MTTEKQNSWYQRGAEGESRSQEIVEDREKSFGPRRVWLKEGTSAKLTFLDSEGFYFYEHNLYLNGRWTNWFTCRRDFDECPICDSGKHPSYVCVYTVIDHSEYVDKKGVVHKNEKKLLVTKSGVQPKIARRKQALENGDLTFSVFQFTRDKREEASTGEDIEYLRTLTRDEILANFKPANMSDEEFLKPFDYYELFEPLPVEKLRQVVGQRVVGQEDNNQNGGESRSGSAPMPEGVLHASEKDINDLL